VGAQVHDVAADVANNQVQIINHFLNPRSDAVWCLVGKGRDIF